MLIVKALGVEFRYKIYVILSEVIYMNVRQASVAEEFASFLFLTAKS
jgi:hypothetical protein